MRRPPQPPRRRRRPAPREDKPYLLEALRETLARLPEPAMLRPDLGTLRGQALLDVVAELEAGGVLVAVDGGALQHRNYADPGERMFSDIGIPHTDVATPLRAAGWTRKDPRLCE